MVKKGQASFFLDSDLLATSCSIGYEYEHVAAPQGLYPMTDNNRVDLMVIQVCTYLGCLFFRGENFSFRSRLYHDVVHCQCIKLEYYTRSCACIESTCVSDGEWE